MSTAKQRLRELIDEIPESDVMEVVDFIGYLKMKREKTLYKDLLKASESSTDFWNSDIDDEVWNNV
ncbi:MAG: DUF2281 domain-containing protein [Clostridia bacterium]|nr:DUF2281 domain-containing protein [Clostridia bacterium]